MTALISIPEIMKLYNLLIGEYLSMEIAKSCKSTYNNQWQQLIYLYHKRNMSQIWQVNTPTPPTNVTAK